MKEKPGYKTTEFWLSLAAILIGAIVASGIFADGSTALKVVGMASSVLGALGYAGQRMFVKGAVTKANAIVEAAKSGNP